MGLLLLIFFLIGDALGRIILVVFGFSLLDRIVKVSQVFLTTLSYWFFWNFFVFKHVLKLIYYEFLLFWRSICLDVLFGRFGHSMHRIDLLVLQGVRIFQVLVIDLHFLLHSSFDLQGLQWLRLIGRRKMDISVIIFIHSLLVFKSCSLVNFLCDSLILALKFPNWNLI